MKPWVHGLQIVFMTDLGSRVAEATSEKCAKSFLFQSLSKNLQNGNALCNWNSSSPQKTILTQKDYLKKSENWA